MHVIPKEHRYYLEYQVQVLSDDGDGDGAAKPTYGQYVTHMYPIACTYCWYQVVYLNTATTF